MKQKLLFTALEKSFLFLLKLVFIFSSFRFFGASDNNIYEEVFDTIFVAPRSPRHDEIKIFTADFGEETERSLHSLSIDFNKNMEKYFILYIKKIKNNNNNNTIKKN